MADPKKGTGKKPKGSGRRLYTDENPRDTVKIKKVMKGLQKASKTHAAQAKTLKGVLNGGSKKRNGKKT